MLSTENSRLPRDCPRRLKETLVSVRRCEVRKANSVELRTVLQRRVRRETPGLVPRRKPVSREPGQLSYRLTVRRISFCPNT
jgi:hypothetical protein